MTIKDISNTLAKECERLRVLAEQLSVLSEDGDCPERFRLYQIAELILDSEDAIAAVIGEW